MLRSKIILFALLGTLIPGSFALAQRPAERGRIIPNVAGIDQDEGQRLIGEFRQQRLQGDFVFLFALENIPRRGQKTHYEGIIWGTWNELGPLNRVVLWEPGHEDKPVMQIIAQSGPEPAVWIWQPDKDPYPLPKEDYFDPLLPNNHYSAFDLLMPFIYWEESLYEGSRRVKGRAAHQFIMWPTEAIRAARPDFGAAFIALDANYNALLRADLMNDMGDAIRTVEIQSFKEVDGQYIIKEIDLTDEASRDKSRFRVRAAAVNQQLSAETFDPGLIEWIPDTRVIPFKGI